MPRAYFDANIYDHIARGYIPIDEVDSIRGPLARRQIVARLSVADIEELLGDWETNRPAAVKRLEVARDLVGFDGILKQPSDLLRESIESYAARRPTPSPLLPHDQQEIVSASLRRVAAGDVELDSAVSAIVSDVRALKERFRARMTNARCRTMAELGTWDPAAIRAITFSAFWETGAPGWAEVCADQFGLAKGCRERGLTGLLDVRPVRLIVGAVMSMMYSQTVGEGDGQSRQPALGDGYDLWHALLASVADVFVTRDERLARSLERIPINDFRVVTSLGALLDR